MPGTRWCPNCVQAAEKFPPHLCPLCQKDLSNLPAGVQDSPHECSRAVYLDRAYAWGWHSNPLRKAIHRLKYQRDLSLAENLSQHLLSTLKSNLFNHSMVVPVPLWPGRQRQRGYNQAALLARPLAYALRLEYQPSALRRERETASQVGLSVVERRENVADAFKARQSLVHNRQVLLVDDVLTTGATLDSAAKALKQAGAKSVSAVVLARAH